MHQVKDERIRKEKTREMFGDIDKVCDFAMRRRLDFIGHTMPRRQEAHQEATHLLDLLCQSNGRAATHSQGHTF
jgi:hypothetical protein